MSRSRDCWFSLKLSQVCHILTQHFVCFYTQYMNIHLRTIQGGLYETIPICTYTLHYTRYLLSCCLWGVHELHDKYSDNGTCGNDTECFCSGVAERVV